MAALHGQAVRINEFWARLPFALAGMAALVAALLLGKALGRAGGGRGCRGAARD